MNRAARRKYMRELKKQGIKGGDIEQKLGMFDRIPDECSCCTKPFDKKSKKMVQTWSVVVRETDKINPVRLYCPTCWQTAKDYIEKVSGENIYNPEGW